MLLEARVEIVAGGDKAGRYNQNTGYSNPSSTILPAAYRTPTPNAPHVCFQR